MAKKILSSNTHWVKSGKYRQSKNTKRSRRRSYRLCEKKNSLTTYQPDRLNKSLKTKHFSGNVSWYGETVKLDLEARKTIERTSAKPPKYRLKSR